MIRKLLIILFGAVFLAMLGITVYASLERSVFAVGPQLLADRWFQATLADAYFGFLTFHVWVAYKEPSLFGRVSWFILIMALGNLAMSFYMLRQLWKWNPERGWESILLRAR
jgi:hypothetical protein